MKYLALILMTASVTMYNSGTTTASGKKVYVGATACPRSIKLGTKVEIDGKAYTCEDRTAKWVEKKFGPTFDIYSTSSTPELFQFGRKKMTVKLF